MLERIWTNQDSEILARGTYTLPYKAHYHEDESGDFLLVGARKKMRRGAIIHASLGVLSPGKGYVVYLENGRFIEALLFPDWTRVNLSTDDADALRTIEMIREDWTEGPHRDIFFPIKRGYGDPYAAKNMPEFSEAWMPGEIIRKPTYDDVLRYAS